MQPSVVPELALEQTLPRPIHWVATATAIAAVIAGSSFVQTDHATAQPTPGPTQTRHHTTTSTTDLPAPDPHDVTYPLRCGPAKVVVQKSATGDLDGDGRPETVAVVHCDAGSGSPPHGVYVVTAAARAGAPARVVATLVDPRDRYTITDFGVRNSTVTATLLGYSSPNVPSCCPDQQEKTQWEWRDGRFVRSAQPRTQAA